MLFSAQGTHLKIHNSHFGNRPAEVSFFAQKLWVIRAGTIQLLSTSQPAPTGRARVLLVPLKAQQLIEQLPPLRTSCPLLRNIPAALPAAQRSSWRSSAFSAA